MLSCTLGYIRDKIMLTFSHDWERTSDTDPNLNIQTKIKINFFIAIIICSAKNQ